MTSMFALWTSVLLALGGPVTEVAITPSAQSTNVLIAVDGDVEYRDFTMEGPYRLVVDLMGSRHALPRDEYADVNRGGVLSVRTSQYSADVVRVVLVLDRSADYTVTSDPRGVRITLANPGADFAPWSSGIAAAAPAPPTDRQPSREPEQEARSTARHISISFTNSPMHDVLLSFASFSGKSVVPGSNVTGMVTATITDQPWDIALRSVLSAYGLVAEEDDYGIIRVDNITDLNAREGVEPIRTQAHRINYAPATEVQMAITPLLTERGKITVGQGTNTVVVSDIERVQQAVRALLTELDIKTPQVSIQAKIIFVNRTDLDEMGVTYELKDSRGNQFNQLSDGAADSNRDGSISPDEVVTQGTPVVLLGGNSVAALGNATERVANPTLSLLTSLVLGRHQLVSFLEAMSSVQLSDVQAIPQVTTLNNQQARLKVGVDVPVRTIDAGAGGGGGGGSSFPTAQVTMEETGIILEATPHVTANGSILLEINAQRSSAEIAASDAGFVKQTQEARTRVLVADGETVVIAGLTQSERTEFRSGIPLLMDLPVIGRLFRVERKNVIQRDLIILVTPHIVRGSN